jgi:thymidylate synthase (FAD)
LYKDYIDTTDTDALHEFAGRTCYLSYHRPNPETANNHDYLQRSIIDNGHTSVLEHANFSFLVTGVSRALLLELERHRHLSFSVLSQRFVGADKFGYVVHPALRGKKYFEQALQWHWETSLERYEIVYEQLKGLDGLSVKQAREAARMFLPECTETRFVVTGNVRHWRHIIEMRTALGADAEIQEFASRIAGILEAEAPNSMLPPSESSSPSKES